MSETVDANLWRQYQETLETINRMQIFLKGLVLTICERHDLVDGDRVSPEGEIIRRRDEEEAIG